MTSVAEILGVSTRLRPALVFQDLHRRHAHSTIEHCDEVLFPPTTYPREYYLRVDDQRQLFMVVHYIRVGGRICWEAKYPTHQDIKTLNTYDFLNWHVASIEWPDDVAPHPDEQEDE